HKVIAQRGDGAAQMSLNRARRDAEHPRGAVGVEVRHRDLPAAAPPPGDVRVQRGTYHPRPWCRMPADRAPRCPRPGKGLSHKLLRQVPVTDAHQHGEQALVLGRAVELREVQSLAHHALSTHNHRAPVTWLVLHARWSSEIGRTLVPQGSSMTMQTWVQAG